MKISKFWKAVVAGVAGLSTTATAAFADDLFDASEAATMTAMLVEVSVGIWAVWKVRNAQADTREG